MKWYLLLICFLALGSCDLYNLTDGGGVRLDVPRFVYHNNPSIGFTIDGAWNAEITFDLLGQNWDWLPQPNLTRELSARSGSFQPNTPLSNGLYRVRSKLITERGGNRLVLDAYHVVAYMDVVTEPLSLLWPYPHPLPPLTSIYMPDFSFLYAYTNRIAVTVQLKQPPISGLRFNSHMAMILPGANGQFYPNGTPPIDDDITLWARGYPDGYGGRLYTFYPSPHYEQVAGGEDVWLRLYNLAGSPDPDHWRSRDVTLP